MNKRQESKVNRLRIDNMGGICYSPKPPKDYLPYDITYVFFAKHITDMAPWNMMWLTQPSLDQALSLDLDKNKWHHWLPIIESMDATLTGKMAATFILDDADTPYGMSLRHYLTLPPLDFLKRLKLRPWWDMPLFEDPAVMDLVESRVCLSAGVEVGVEAESEVKAVITEVVGNVAYAEFRGKKERLACERSPLGVLDHDGVIAATGNLVDSLVDEDISDVSEKNGLANEIMSANLDIEVTFDSIESTNMEGGAVAFIIYLNIANNQKKRVQVELLFSSYVTCHGEEIVQDAWLTGLAIGEDGAAIRAGAFKKTGLVFNQPKLKSISAGDRLYVAVLLPEHSQQFNYSFVCRNSEQHSFALIEACMEDTAETEEISSPQPAEKNDAMPGEHGTMREMANIVEHLQSLEEKLSGSLARAESIGDVRASGKQTVRAAIDFIKQHPTLFAAEISELRAFLGEPFITPSVVPVEVVTSSLPEPQTLAQIIAWLATLEMVTVADLRTRLLPLDLLPGAVIDDLNERALDLTGDLAIEEDGEEFVIAREVLAQVVATW